MIMPEFIQRQRRNLSTVIIVVLFSIGLWQLASAGWIQGKAIIAQQLLKHAWHKTRLDAGQPHRPWPWADTWPVAKLTVPEYGIEQIILAGDSGSSLAFAPGYSFASARPNTSGTTVISAHRDTHFRFLKDLKQDDLLYIQSADNSVQYRVYDFQIVDSRTFTLPDDADENTLLLVTCYPFDAITAGGPLRYLVFAKHQHS
jgi:sortase A